MATLYPGATFKYLRDCDALEFLCFSSPIGLEVIYAITCKDDRKDGRKQIVNLVGFDDFEAFGCGRWPGDYECVSFGREYFIEFSDPISEDPRKNPGNFIGCIVVSESGTVLISKESDKGTFHQPVFISVENGDFLGPPGKGIVFTSWRLFVLSGDGERITLFEKQA